MKIRMNKARIKFVAGLSLAAMFVLSCSSEEQGSSLNAQQAPLIEETSVLILQEPSFSFEALSEDSSSSEESSSSSEESSSSSDDSSSSSDCVPEPDWDESVCTDWYYSQPDTTTVYDICKACDLAGLAELVNNSNVNFLGKTINLRTDIKLNDKPWVPIGGQIGAVQRTFKGTFNGNGYIISGLNANSSYTPRYLYYYGLFGRASDGSILNLGLEGVNVYGRYAGGIVANGTNVDISNSYVVGSVGGVSELGGIIGYNTGGIISDSYFIGDINATGNYIGGVVGRNSAGTIQRSYAHGVITASGTYKGGLVGYHYGGWIITSSYSLAGTPSNSGTTAAGANGAKLTEDQFKQKASFVGWNFNTIWAIDGDVNSGLPRLKMFDR
jgi:hypothetical protein